MPNDIPAALDALADEDADKDGVPNLIEILSGRLPGDAKDVPTLAERAEAAKKLAASGPPAPTTPGSRSSRSRRPAVPGVKNPGWVRNPIDAFVAEQHEKQGLKPRPEASKAILLRRVYLDLIGLPPTPDQLHAFLNDRISRRL